MAKKKTYFLCSECGHREPKWLGRCPECDTWNSFTENSTDGAYGRGSGRSSGASGKYGVARPVPLETIEAKGAGRFDCGIAELNRVLGGGVMKGSAVLVGGEPGIGKSTLMLNLADAMAGPGKVLYISGEESAGQVKMRADRLGATCAGMEILCETEIETVLGAVNAVKPVVVIVDSIQTLYSPEVGAVPGTVSQLKYCCYELIQWAREQNGSLMLVAHVTKEGSIAGPKVIEHMVDTVLYFDHAAAGIRILRTTKNRFGSTDEIGIFTMESTGLRQVQDAAKLFLVEREGGFPAGTAVAPVYEGSRILLVEIQALTVPAKGGMSRVFSDLIDSRRVSRVAAVMEKHIGLRFSDQDLYVNVAGGIRLNEVGIELPLAMALYSARSDIVIAGSPVIAGEVSLAGEVRPIPFIERRIRTAREMGFSGFVGPAEDTASGARGYTPTSTLSEAVRVVFGNGKK
jgi:DNA repair protein RadA/Sms